MIAKQHLSSLIYLGFGGKWWEICSHHRVVVPTRTKNLRCLCSLYYHETAVGTTELLRSVKNRVYQAVENLPLPPLWITIDDNH
mmetsp:Transcript_17109/g.30099  ORF Transcript_17109/g.30099 Transcript_17109/m.30099 type:complete len:84 (+) Transcript_17109:995-1246(+)